MSTSTPLRVLFLEDEPDDVQLLLHELRRANFEPVGKRVDNEEDYLAQLDPAVDVILSDHSMPGFNGLRGLQLMRERGLDIPYIFISGTMGEDVAVAAMQQGAADYLLKDRLTRLGLAIRQAVARRRLKEEKLLAEQTTARLAAIVDSSSDAIIATTLEGGIVNWNRAAERLFGYTAAEIVGKSQSILFPTGRRRDDIPEDFERQAQQLRNGEWIEPYETVRVRKDRRRVDVLVSMSPIFDPRGQVLGASFIVHDNSQRKRAERFLAAEHGVTRILAQAQSMEEASPILLQHLAECLRWEVAILWKVDRAANVLRRVHTWQSPWAQQTFIDALDDETMLEPGTGFAGRVWSGGEPVWEHKGAVPGANVEAAGLGREGLRGAFGLPMRFGSQMVGVIEFYNPELRQPDVHLLAALENIASQISQFNERRQIETDVRASEERFRNLIFALPVAVYTTDREGKITLFNDEAVKLWGRRPQIGKELWSGALRLFRPDGAPLPPEECATAVLLREGHWVRGQEIIVERPDGTRATVLPHPEPLRNSAGETIGVVNMLVDLTQTKQLESQLRQAQKMEAVGSLAGGIAHDFNNLLTIINGFSEIALCGLAPDHRLREMLTEIHKAGERAAALTRQLLAFSRKQVLQPVVLDLNGLVGEVGKMVRRLVGEDVEITTDLAPSLGEVQADPGQLEQVIMNLVVNARDAMPTGGKLTITTRNITREEGEGPYGPYTLLAVQDTGCGMNAATQARLFEPFFTTKGQGKGTGLGLATVYGIVKQSGGLIEVDTRPGNGTTFRIYFPHARGKVATHKSHPGMYKLPTGTETILLAEDEEGVRTLTSLALRSCGYTVLEARSGHEALDLCQRYQGPIHLLITDVVMPKMSGRQVSELIRALRSDIQVLYLSGYTDDALIRHGVEAGKMPFLQKPFTAATLACKVREVLEEEH